MTDLSAPPLLAAARGERAAHTPVWFMRQAGRHLPEYRAIRGEGSILHAIRNPELATEITLQPVRRYGVDAAVLYSDIVVPAHAVGFGIDVAPGTGPVATDPFRRAADLDRLPPLTDEHISYVIETCKQAAAELDPAVPLITFAGAPFTVASYLVEGRPSRDYAHTKALMHTEEVTWHRLLDRLADHAVAFISAGLRSGARAFQLFDSWAGALSKAEYQRFVLPHTSKVFAELRRLHEGVAGIHFGVGCSHLLTSIAEASPDVMGLDWRTPIDEARRLLGATTVVQGNLDPALVMAGWPVARDATEQVLAANGGHPGHIFNLGHGVLPETDPGVLAEVVTLVHDATRTDG